MQKLKLLPLIFIIFNLMSCADTPGEPDAPPTNNQEAGKKDVTDAQTAVPVKPDVTTGSDLNDSKDQRKDITKHGISQPGSEQTPSPLNDPDNILSNKTIYFDFDSDFLSEETRNILRAHAEYLSKNPNVSVILEGHCDERGSREYNLALGDRRSNSVNEFLEILGASEGQMENVSYGEEKPIELGHDESAWKRNRRVEIIYK